MSGAGSVVQKDSPSPEDAILFVGMCLVLGMASRQIFTGTRVPYTVVFLLLGIGLGALGAPNSSFLTFSTFSY